MENKSEMPLKLTDSLSVHVMLDDSPHVYLYFVCVNTLFYYININMSFIRVQNIHHSTRTVLQLLAGEDQTRLARRSAILTNKMYKKSK